MNKEIKVCAGGVAAAIGIGEDDVVEAGVFGEEGGVGGARDGVSVEDPLEGGSGPDGRQLQAVLVADGIVSS